MTDRQDNIEDDYHISANYQQPSILPKVRPSSNTSSTTQGSNEAAKRLPVPAVPATPRMLRNSSGNFSSQSQSQTQTPTPAQGNPRGVLINNRTPQRSNSDAHRKRPSAVSAADGGPSYYQSPVAPANVSPSRGKLAPIDTNNAATGASSSLNNGSRKQPSPGDGPTKLLPAAKMNSDVPPPITTTPQRSPTNPRKQQPTQFHRRSIGDWDFMKTIGAGSMGKVKLAKHRKTGEICAIKIVPRAARLYARAHANDAPPADSDEALARRKEYEKEVARDRRTIREASLGKILYHPFICRLFEVITMSNHFYMLFEYVSGGQMLDYIVSHGSLKERNARKFARGIGSALDYLHKNNVVHRDLKIENIMISKTGDIKIIDFGLSNLFSNDTLLKTYCGSLYFAAPELLSAHPYIGPEVDVWSFGVVLYVLVCGKVPFDDESVGVLHEKIKKGKVEYPDFLSSEVVSLLSRMLVVNPNKRAHLSEVLAHPWMIRGYDTAPVSFIPHRTPLNLPLDPLVVREMANLEFGQSEEQIANDLSLIISSDIYTESSKQWNKTKDLSSLGVDPTTGFHPLVSIYFLVQEMLVRKQAKESIVDVPSASLETDQVAPQQLKDTPQETSNTPKQPPVLSFPEAVHTSPHSSTPPLPTTHQLQASNTAANEEFIVQQQLHHDETKGLNSILRKFSQRRSNSIKRPSDQHPVSYQDSNQNNQDHFVRRVGSMKISDKKPSFEGNVEQQVPNSKKHTRTVSAHTGSQAVHNLNTNNAQRKFHPSARAKSVGHRRDHAQFAAANEITQVPPIPSDLNEDAFFDDVTLDEYLPGSNTDKVTLVNSNTSSTNRRNEADGISLTEDQIVREAARAPPGTMPSIEYPKTMFLKGLFSVQTTSSKPLPVIRANVISTLTKFNVKFTEVRGGFICVHTPSIEQPTIVVTSDAGNHKDAEYQQQHGIERSGSMKSGKSSSGTSGDIGKPLEKHSNDDRSSFGETSFDQTSNLNNRVHRRKFSIGGSILGYRRKHSGAAPPIPNTPIAATASPSARNFTGHEFDSSASLESLNAAQGGSDMLISSRIEQNKVHNSGENEEDENNAISAVTEGYKPASAKVSSTSSRTPLKFEIHVVKVPLVGLFGVHFKKITGNTWMYKTLAGQILNELNL